MGCKQCVIPEAHILHVSLRARASFRAGLCLISVCYFPRVHLAEITMALAHARVYCK